MFGNIYIWGKQECWVKTLENKENLPEITNKRAKKTKTVKKANKVATKTKGKTKNIIKKSVI